MIGSKDSEGDLLMDEEGEHATPGALILFDYLKDQPEAVRKRVSALKQLQLETLKMEADFCRKVFELEQEYRAMQQPAMEKRRLIITGEYEPSEEECALVPNDNILEEVTEKLRAYRTEHPEPSFVAGIPEFWSIVLRNRDVIAETITERDEKALAYLMDVKCAYMTNRPGFVLSFHFAPNEYFTNSVLTKEYLLKLDIDLQKPFMYSGPEILSRKGCAIDWKPNKNLTIRTVVKRAKNRQQTYSSKTTSVDSFFNFFDPALDYVEGQELTMEKETLLEQDYEIAQALRDDVIPQAVLYFTGETIENDVDEETEEYESETESE